SGWRAAAASSVDDAVELVGGEAARRGQRDVGGETGRLLARVDAEDAVGVDREGDLDADAACGAGRQAFQGETAEVSVVARVLRVALKDLDRDVVLVFAGRREHPARARRHSRVPRYDDRGVLADAHAERVGRDVEQHDLVELAGQQTGMRGSA